MNRLKPPIWAPGIRTGHPLANGLIFCAPLWEGAGSVRDLVGGNAAALAGNADWKVLDTGPGLTNPGAAADGVNFGNIPIGSGEAQLTVAGLVRPDVASTEDMIASKHSGGPFYLSFLGAGDLRFMTQTAGGRVDTDSPCVPSTTEFGLYAGTYDGATVRLYANGVQLANTEAQTGALTSTAGNFWIGNYGTGAVGWSFNGDIALAAVWNRALSAGEIAQLYADPWCMFRPVRLGHLWAASTAALDGYYIYRGLGLPRNIDWDNEVGDVTGASATLTGLGHLASTKYYYGIRPYRDIGGGTKLVTPTHAAIAEFETDAGGEWVGSRPAPVRGLAAEVQADGTIELRWRFEPGDRAAPARFDIWYGTSDALGGGAADETVTYAGRARYTKSIAGLSDATGYFFRVQAATSGNILSKPVTIGPHVADSTAPAAPDASIAASF